jgi:hypothetical protein
MRQAGHLFGLTFLGTLVFIFLGIIPSISAVAEVYVHHTPIKIAWDHATPEAVDHFNVYVSVDDAPFDLVGQPSALSYSLEAEDGRKYVFQADAEDPAGNLSPLSAPLTAVVYLNGSAEDTDGDGMHNEWEVSFLLNPFDPSDGDEDLDGDGLSNTEEFLAGTIPTNPDTDQDGMQDGAETQAGLNPLDPMDNRPVAEAGEDQDLDPTVVTLDGSGSFDPNGDPLAYEWSQLEGTGVELSNSDVATPSFLGKAWGLYRFGLQVNDGKITSVPDEVSVTIRNIAPAADAGQDQVLDAGTQVTLDGSGSQDPNEDSLSCTWSQTEGPTVVMDDDRACTTSFVPRASGVHVFRLIVSDGELSSPPDQVQVVVNAVNQVPTANAGEDQLALVNDTVTLDGSGSTDPDGDPLTYAWDQAEGPATVTLEGASSVVTRFTPSEAGTYRFELVVSDGENTSATDDVAVTVENENRVPVAMIGDVDGPVNVGDWVILDGQASYDPDGDPLGYQWTQTAGAQVSLDDPDAQVIGFYAVTEGVLRFQLVVQDGELTSAPALVEITVDGSNQVPIADAGSDLRGGVGQRFCLNGSGSYDPDPGDTLTYLWSQTGGPLVTLNGHNTPTPCFVPSVKGKYAFILIVSDGEVQSTADTVIVRVKK